MLGIMLARPVASLITEALPWHAVFTLSAAMMTALAVVLRLALARRTPVLQRRALYQACLFAAFSLFWTAAPLLLADTFHLSQNGIALFALAGVAGAVAAPIAGRAADRGWTRPATGLAMAAVAGSLLLSRLGLDGSPQSWACHAGRRGGAAGFRRDGERRAGPARHLRAWRRGPQPAQRPLHGGLLRWRGRRVGAGRLELRPWRLVPCDVGRAWPAGAGPGRLPDRTPENPSDGDHP